MDTLMLEGRTPTWADLTDDMLDTAGNGPAHDWEALRRWCDYFGVDENQTRQKLLTLRLEQQMFTGGTLTRIDELLDNLRSVYKGYGLRIQHEGALVLVTIWRTDDELRRALRLARNQAMGDG